MVDRIDKTLRKLDPKRRAAFEHLLQRIIEGKFQGLDVVKLKGSENIFRVRKGDYRIIFRKLSEREITVIAFEHRRESTYRF